MREVNRHLEDAAMDHIDHALGRPLDPTAKTYRDHFAACAGSDLAEAMRRSPHWRKGMTCGGMTFFFVTDEGRRALADHLRQIGDPHRGFDITFEGHTTRVVAPSRSKARYRYWLDLSDSISELTFADFCRRSRVAPADRGEK